MVTSIVIFALTVLGVIFSIVFGLHFKIGKTNVSLYWIVAVAGALCTVLFGLVTFEDIRASFFTNTAVNPLKILVLFLSMTVISVFLDEAGFYGHIAAVAVKRAGKNQKKLFLLLYGLVSVLTVFTSNDIIILTFTPFILYFSQKSDIDPAPYIFGEFVAANTWSMFFVFGNPTNIYIATAFGVDFVTYAIVMASVTILSGLTALGILLLIFRKPLSKPIGSLMVEQAPEDRVSSIIGIVFLALCIVGMAIASYVGFEMWPIALLFGALCLILAAICLKARHKDMGEISHTIKKLPWPLIPFLLAMFLLIISLERSGVTELLSSAIPDNLFVYGFASFLGCNIFNNIPMSVLFTSLLGASPDLGSVYSVIIGSNLGALFTPVGALAGIMWMNIIRDHSIRFTFLTFMKYGAAISLPLLAVTLGGLYFALLFGI